MRKLLVSLILLVACGSDGPSRELATIYDYSYSTLDQPTGYHCNGTGVLDFAAETLGVSTECSGGGGTAHATVPLTNVAQDGARLTFVAWDCAHTGTIADEEINGTVTCVAQPGTGGLDLSGTWSAQTR
jgi:hypothetical protein